MWSTDHDWKKHHENEIELMKWAWNEPFKSPLTSCAINCTKDVALNHLQQQVQNKWTH